MSSAAPYPLSQHSLTDTAAAASPSSLFTINCITEVYAENVQRAYEQEKENYRVLEGEEDATGP